MEKEFINTCGLFDLGPELWPFVYSSNAQLLTFVGILREMELDYRVYLNLNDLTNRTDQSTGSSDIEDLSSIV